MEVIKKQDFIEDLMIQIPIAQAVEDNTVEAIPKADYEARLKADMVAMLTELQLEVEELCINNPLAECEEDMNRGIEKAVDVIQEKINALKAESEHKE